MLKLATSCCILFMLTACASAPSQTSNLEEETLLVRSGNTEKLVEFYKLKLAENESRETRLKLARAYLDSGDAESALFFVSPLNLGEGATSESFFVEANSLFQLSQFERAKSKALDAYKIKNNDAEIENLLGMIHASMSDFSESRRYFNLARTHLYDDIKIKNNLAVLSIIEGKYQNAVQLLLPIYLKGKADKQIEANLTLAMAKIGNISYIRDMVSNELTDEQVFERYQALRDSQILGEFKSGGSSDEKK